MPDDVTPERVAAARGTVRSAVGGLQAEVRAVVGGHEVHLLGMLLDVVPDEGAVGQNGQAALPRGGEDACYQRRPEAAAAHAGIDLGVRQRHRAAVDVVARQAHDAVTDQLPASTSAVVASKVGCERSSDWLPSAATTDVP